LKTISNPSQKSPKVILIHNFKLYDFKSFSTLTDGLLRLPVLAGASPYASIALVDLYRLLTNGYRLEQPKTCSDEL